MKKTLIINIGNSIIHIEEDAYEILTAYLNEIKQHFAKNADDFEIVTDIENRIAEMLNELLQAAQRQVVEIADIESVIAQMGRVQDFETTEEETPNETYNPQYDFNGTKKLYRDTDEGVIAGVCAGLGHYFNIEARWVRLIVFLTVFLGGSGFLAYLILWIAMPRATTRAQRMQMKGEATNLYGYKRSFDEELAAFKENMNQFGPYVKKSGNFITETVNALGKVLGQILKLATKIIAVFFIIFGFVGLISLVVSLSALLGLWDANPFDFFPFSVINENVRDEVALAAFVTCFIPLLVLILFAIRVAFNKKALTRTASFALLIIWLIGVGTTGYYAAKISSEFQEHAELIKTVDLKAYKTYTIDLDNAMGFSKQDSSELHIDDKNFDGHIVSDDRDEHPFRAPRKIRLVVEKSEDGKVSMMQNFQSQGKTFQKALTNAQNITYQFTQTDSLLMLSPRFQLKEKAVWRNQEAIITLKLPIGTRIFVNENIRWNLGFYYSCSNYEENNSDYREWIMTEDGLKCKFDLTTEKISEEESRKNIEALQREIDKQREIAEKLQRNRSEEVDKLTRQLEELREKKRRLEELNRQ